MAGQRRHTSEDIVEKLRQADELASSGATAAELAGHLGVSTQTYHRWRKQFNGGRPPARPAVGTLPDGLVDSPQLARIRLIAAELFAAKSYHAIGIAEIGEAVGLARGSLYHHISSKEQLLYEISVRYIFQLVVSGRAVLDDESDPKRRITTLSAQLMETIFRHKAEMTVCFREVDSLTGERRRVVADMHLEYQRVWEECIEDGAAKGVFRPISVVEVKGLLGIYFYSFLWLDTKRSGRASDIGQKFADLVIRALRA